MISSGGLSGGLSSAIEGGNFWSGVREGLITAGLNHAMHSVVDGGGEGDPKKNVKKQEPKYKVINNTDEAKEHYYNGKGKPVIIGNETTNELRNSPEYQRVINRLKNCNANNLNGSFDVDMTGNTFHVGDTNVDYTTTINKNGTVTTTFIEFVDDGYWDPDFINESPKFMRGIAHPSKVADGMGPNLELGGIPYRYIPSTYILIYKNPGYKNN